MKHQAIQYLAFDVHQATIVATLRDQGGGIVMRATIPTEAKAILTLIRSAGPRVHVAFEEGTQAQWLHDLIAPHAERVMVCNTRGEGERGNKSDRLDADRLSERLRLGALKSVFHGAKTLLTLKELVRNYNNLVEDSTRVMQRIKALFRARAILTPGVSVYRLSQREQWLSRLSGGAQTCLAHILRRVEGLLEICTTRAGRQWLREHKRTLQRAISVRDRRDAAELGAHGLCTSTGQIEAAIDRLLDRFRASTGLWRPLFNERISMAMKEFPSTSLLAKNLCCSQSSLSRRLIAHTRSFLSLDRHGES